MAPIFSNNTKYLKSSVQNHTDIFVTKKQYLQWKPHLNRLKWRRVTGNWRNSYFPPHDHIWSKLKGFTRRKQWRYSPRRKDEAAKDQNCSFFWFSIRGAMTRILLRNTSLWRHNDVFRDETRVSTTYAKPKNYTFDPLQLRLFSIANTFIVFAL